MLKAIFITTEKLLYYEICSKLSLAPLGIITPHAQHKRGKRIVVGVHIYIYIGIYIGMFVDKKKIESFFSDRLTISNILGRTSR